MSGQLFGQIFFQELPDLFFVDPRYSLHCRARSLRKHPGVCVGLSTERRDS